MATANQSLLPVHEFLVLLEHWRNEPSDTQRARLGESLGRVLADQIDGLDPESTEQSIEDAYRTRLY